MVLDACVVAVFVLAFMLQVVVLLMGGASGVHGAGDGVVVPVVAVLMVVVLAVVLIGVFVSELALPGGGDGASVSTRSSCIWACECVQVTLAQSVALRFLTAWICTVEV